MRTKLFLGILPLAIVLVLCLSGPVSAETKNITMAYQGAGGYYIGDTILFLGYDSLSPTVVVKITGPGLPPEGVPPYNPAGTPGTGNTAAVDSSGLWTFSWDTSNIQNDSLLQTARYTLTAMDSMYPDQSVTTSIMLRRPDFSATVTPNPAQPGSYVQIVGNTQTSISSVNIAVINSSGNQLRTFNVPVSATGYFYYSFHFDMPTGTYSIVVTNPLRTTQSVTIPLTVTETAATPSPAGTSGAPVTTIPSTETSPAASTLTPAAAVSTVPTSTPLPPLVAIGGVCGALILSSLLVRKK